MNTQEITRAAKAAELLAIINSCREIVEHMDANNFRWHMNTACYRLPEASRIRIQSALRNEFSALQTETQQKLDNL